MTPGLPPPNPPAAKREQLTRVLDELLRRGLRLGMWGLSAGTAFVLAPAMDPATQAALVAGVGVNAFTSLMDRAAHEDPVADTELARALQSVESHLEQHRELVERAFAALAQVVEFQLEFRRTMEVFGEQSQWTLRLLTHQIEVLPDTLREVVREVLREALTPGPPGAGALRLVLADYLDALLRSPRHRRLTPGGLPITDAVGNAQAAEPELADVFVEPNLAGADLLRAPREQIGAILSVALDDETDDVAGREQERLRALRLQDEAWQSAHEEERILPAHRILETHTAAVILGDPGSGKTTLLRWLLLRRAKACRKALETEGAPPGPLPVFLRIGHYAAARAAELGKGEGLSLERYLVERDWEDRISGALGPALAAALAPGGSGVLLCLDGLDEVPSEIRRPLVQALLAFLDRHTGAGKASRVLLTSRIYGYAEAPLAGVEQFVVAPFADDQVREFSRKWHAWVERTIYREGGGSELIRRHAGRFEAGVFSRPQVRRLAGNPLLLSMIAVLVLQGKQFPEHRVELYDLMLRQLMTRWDHLRRETEDLEPHPGHSRLPTVNYEEACALWGPIARWMHERGTGAVFEKDLRERLRLRLAELERDEDPEDWLRVRGDQCCLLLERGPGVFGFLHRTFEEYLAARSLYDFDNAAFCPELDRYLANPDWREVILLSAGYLGLVAPTGQKRALTRLLERMLDTPPPFETLLHRGLFLAAACLADNIRPPRRVTDRILAGCLTIATGGEHDTITRTALACLCETARVGCVPTLAPDQESALEPLAQHRNRQIRASVAHWLAQTPAPFGARLLETLAQDPDADVSGLARFGLLRRSPGPETARAFTDRARLGLFLTPGRSAAIVSLLRDSPNVVGALVRLLQDPDPDVRCRTARLLLATEERPAALQALVRLLHDPDLDVRSNAGRALPGKLLDPAALQALVRLLQHPDPDVRSRAAGLLRGNELDPAALQALIPLLQDPDPDVRSNAAGLLRREEMDPATLQGLSRLLRDPDPHVRSIAAASLRGTNGWPAALQALVPLLQDPDPHVRSRAAGSLRGQAMDPAALQGLRRLLQDPDPHVRATAAASLGGTNEWPAALQALVPLLENPDPDVRSAASRSLQWGVLNPAAHRALVRLLQDPDPHVRLTAVVLLHGRSLDSTVLQVLVGLLEDPDTHVRSNAAGLLQRQALDPAALQALVGLLVNSDAPVRSKAAELLLSTEERPAALQTLVQLLQNPDSHVRLTAAEELLATSERPATLQALVRLLEDPNPYVGSNAAESLHGQLLDPDALQALVRLHQNADDDVRARVAGVLKASPDPGAVLPVLEAHLRESGGWPVTQVRPSDPAYFAALTYAHVAVRMRGRTGRGEAEEAAGR